MGKDQKALGYIYKTTNLISGSFYIGQHRAKEFEPDKYLGSGTILVKAISMYGKENFQCELLEWCYSPEELNSREVHWIEYYNAYKSSKGYNLTKGGEGALGMIHSENTRHLKSIAMKGKLGIPIICIETQKEYPSSTEAAFQLGISSTGISHCCNGFQNTCCGYHWAYLNDKNRQEFFKSFIGQPQGNYHYRNSRPVLCIEAQMVYKSIEEAVKATGFVDIAACVRGEASHTWGYHWCYLEDKEKIQIKPVKYRKNIRIRCIETGEIFNSLKEASHAYGSTSSSILSGALNKPTKTFKGLHWEKLI